MLLPFFSRISKARSVLIAGAGGGFDLVSGIPLYLYLRSLGIDAVLANLSFAALPFSDCEEVFAHTYRISESGADLPYFPEKYLLEWLHLRGEAPPLYAFSNKVGVQPLRAAYAYVVDRHQIDTLILVDGGTDSLMFGDEAKVGTIVEDACSIVAAGGLGMSERYVAAIGFGVEHELNHHACLENIAELGKAGRYLGALSLTDTMVEGAAYLDLVKHLNSRMTLHESIVTNSIASAMCGEFGDFHSTRRTRGSIQFVSPLMSLFWFFSLEGIASRIRFSESIEHSLTMDEVAKAFQRYRAMNSRRSHQSIPLK